MSNATSTQDRTTSERTSPQKASLGTSWALAYVLIAIPTLIALCFMTQVFRSLDEPAHFLRIVQLAQGGLLPVLGADHHSTGSYQSAGVADFTSFYGTQHKDFMKTEPKASGAETARLYEYQDEGPTRFVEHSNTTIYFPTAYLPSLLGMTVARAFSARPLIWFYSARLSSAIIIGIITAFGLYWAQSFAPVLFVIAVTPIVLFQAAALSADGFLVAATITAAALVRVVLDRKSMSPFQLTVLVLLCFFIGLSKFAYLPIAATPLFVSIAARRRVGRNEFMLAICILAVLAISFYWGTLVKPLTFTVRQDPDAYRVNVDDQIHYVLSNPPRFLYILLKTMVSDAPLYFASFNGRILGWFDLKLPVFIPILSALFLVSNAIFGSYRRFHPSALCIVLITSAMSVGAVFLLLYLQWNNVGAEHIFGVQGRYFIPLAPLVCVCLPRWEKPAAIRPWFGVATVSWGVASAVATMTFTTIRYWQL